MKSTAKHDDHTWTVDSVDSLIPKCPICGKCADSVMIHTEQPKPDLRPTFMDVLFLCIMLGMIVAFIVSIILDKRGLLK